MDQKYGENSHGLRHEQTSNNCVQDMVTPRSFQDDFKSSCLLPSFSLEKINKSKIVNQKNVTIKKNRILKEDKQEEGECEKPLDQLVSVERLLIKIFRDEEFEMEEFKLSILELHILAELLIRKNRLISKEKLSNKAWQRSLNS